MSLAKGAQLAAIAALSVITVVLVVLAMTRTVATTSVSQQPSSNPSAVMPTEAPAATPEVTVIGDDRVLREGSWFFRAVPAEEGGAVQQGAVLAEDGARIGALEDMTDQVLPTDIVLIAAGPTDVELGETPPTILADLKSLVRSVRAQEAYPALVLMPPSNDRGFLTKLVNRKMRAYAERRRIPVVDIYSGLADEPGNWMPRYTDDGVYANEAGAELQAKAVTETLTEIVESRR